MSLKKTIGLQFKGCYVRIDLLPVSKTSNGEDKDSNFGRHLSQPIQYESNIAWFLQKFHTIEAASIPVADLPGY